MDFGTDAPTFFKSDIMDGCELLANLLKYLKLQRSTPEQPILECFPVYEFQRNNVPPSHLEDF
jgi:hypothetical protein